MSDNRPSITEVKQVIDSNIFVACPNVLIDSLNQNWQNAISNDWLSMHYKQIETNDEEDLDDSEYHEIFEYYLVSPWFGEGMKMIGEPAMELETGIWIWGRTESGLNLEHSGVIGDMMIAWGEKINNILNA